MPSATLPDSLEAALVLGLAEQLGTWDIVTFEASGEYDVDAVRPVYLGPNEPVNAPDDRVVLVARTPLAVGESRRTVDVPVGIGWRSAVDADPLEAVKFLGLIRRRLVRLGRVDLGGIPVNGVRHQYSGALGRDTARRLGASATYLFRCREATANG
jgi:hypothetical protein